ncbi:hypothetical protein BKG92_05835 [Rodentibacter ratti]|uniref:Uncharacterized protein n=1 Tax=Rodentibacter ratti TaxID=1906745 RepID=A0A1V3L008_9PAST|nr:hypothetical protein [Rodentibacter ratti]OOF82713.1 hypothetical protein BKG92_05835 [Rodentibacter ratti]
MKKLFQVLFAVLFFIGSNTVAASQNKNTTTKQAAVKQSKKTQVKKPVEKKSTKKVVEKKKTVQKKSSTKVSKTSAKTQVSNGKKTMKSQPTKLTKNKQKEVKKVEKTKTAAQDVSIKKIEKVESPDQILKTTQPKQTTKNVIVPKCQDNQVAKVLSDAFKQQGKVTGTQMTVKQIKQARETQYYPQQAIRSCHALVETHGKKYQTDYSVILNGSGFFVQVENAQPML